MKQLLLQSEAYRYIVLGFSQWLQTMGYHAQTVQQLPLYVQELLHYAEGKGHSSLDALDNKLILAHYQKLKTRANQRRGGGLSNNYLNKHQDAYRLFREYLSQSGRMLLPLLDLRSESEEDRITDLVTLDEITLLYETTRAPYELQKNDRGPVYHEAMQLRDRAMLSVFYGCGLRRNEGYHLDRGDIYQDRSLLHVRQGKNYRQRWVPMTGVVLDHLTAYLYEGRPYLQTSKTEAFFLSQTGTRLSGAAMLVRLQSLINRTGNAELMTKDIHLHSLRHSIATHLLASGMTLERIKEFLGHTSLESTQIYTHYAATLPSTLSI